MPLYGSSGLKYDDNQGGYVVDSGFVFPVTNTFFNPDRSYCGIFTNRFGLNLFASLREPSPSVGRRELDFNPEKLRFSHTDASAVGTTLTLKPDNSNGGYFSIEKYDNRVGEGLWTFAIMEDSVCCGASVFNPDVPKSWELTFSGIANVLEEYRIKNVKVVGTRQPAISDLPPDFTLADVGAKLNSILATMRQHGLIAT